MITKDKLMVRELDLIEECYEKENDRLVSQDKRKAYIQPKLKAYIQEPFE